MTVDEAMPMRWITRENIRVDRVACPWLIRRFVERDAEFRAIAHGFAALGLPVEERLRQQFPISDALYTYAQRQAERSRAGGES